jgi:hypothetical protein
LGFFDGNERNSRKSQSFPKIPSGIFENIGFFSKVLKDPKDPRKQGVLSIMGSNWLQDVLGSKMPTDPAKQSLARQWVAEVADAKAGAAWFASWSPACKARWAASLAWVAREDRLEVPGDLLRWVETLSEEYHE